MGKVVVFAAVSLDGFVADEHDQVGPPFDWCSCPLSSGPVV